MNCAIILTTLAIIANCKATGYGNYGGYQPNYFGYRPSYIGGLNGVPNYGGYNNLGGLNGIPNYGGYNNNGYPGYPAYPGYPNYSKFPFFSGFPGYKPSVSGWGWGGQLGGFKPNYSGIRPYRFGGYDYDNDDRYGSGSEVPDNVNSGIGGYNRIGGYQSSPLAATRLNRDVSKPQKSN